MLYDPNDRHLLATAGIDDGARGIPRGARRIALECRKRLEEELRFAPGIRREN